MIKSEALRVRLLRYAAFAVFSGRAWQHLFWDAPYRELFWDQELMEPLLGVFTSMPWHEFAASAVVDDAISGIAMVIGLFYLICALCVLIVKKGNSRPATVVIAGSVSLFILALVYTKESFYHAGQFFEYALQVGAPYFLVLALKKNPQTHKRLIWLEKLAIALTFSCHGLYALGYYPIPGSFLTMTMNILGTSEQEALLFLKIAGILDFAVAIGCFLPLKWGRFVLLYAAFWGMATAIARIWGNFYLDFPLESLHQWLHEVIYRLPHALVPLALITAGSGPGVANLLKWRSFPDRS